MCGWALFNKDLARNERTKPAYNFTLQLTRK